MSCRRVQGSYRRIDIGHPAATKSSRNLYRRAADTGNFQHSLASSRGTPQGIGGPPIHFTGKKIKAWYRRPVDTEGALTEQPTSDLRRGTHSSRDGHIVDPGILQERVVREVDDHLRENCCGDTCRPLLCRTRTSSSSNL